MNREELEAQIMWNGGGTGFGICPVAASMMHAMDRPGPDKPDLPSIVTLRLPKEKYTDDELETIVAFSKRMTADYDKRNSYRRGANFIILDKREDGKWLRKRLSWTEGPLFSDTLDEALAIMGR